MLLTSWPGGNGDVLVEERYVAAVNRQDCQGGSNPTLARDLSQPSSWLGLLAVGGNKAGGCSCRPLI